MFFKLLLAFTVIPIVELYFLIRVGRIIGPLPTLGLVLLTGIVGAALARSQGLQVLSKISREAAAGKLPANELIQGFILLAGGLTLLTPGFVTDALGLSMILPPTRALYARMIQNYIKTRMLRSTGTVEIDSYTVHPPS